MEHGVALKPHVVVCLNQTSINTDIWCCLRVRFEETPNCYCLIVCPIALSSCYGTHCRVQLSLLSFDIRFMCVLSCNCNLLHNCLHAEFRSCWYVFCRLFPLSILRYSWTDQRVKTFVSSISKFNFASFVKGRNGLTDELRIRHLCHIFSIIVFSWSAILEFVLVVQSKQFISLSPNWLI